jgi:3'-phosphoadenosine 5'-phosphosulfate sulfotransferase (PAPS reductase)/FAD synthetase
MLTKDNQIKANIPKKDRSMFSCERYKFLLDSPYKISNKCCSVMKKSPAHEYARKTGRMPITAQMASESRLRTQTWLQHGCNGFDMKNPVSNPMSFWTEQDILLYIRKNKIPICSVYGEIVTDDEENGQMTLADVTDLELFDLGRPALHTTGCNRTGCMFCGYGCHLEKSPGRFERMKITHPKLYEYIMKPWDQGGLNYKEVIDWINEHGDLHIKY